MPAFWGTGDARGQGILGGKDAWGQGVLRDTGDVWGWGCCGTKDAPEEVMPRDTVCLGMGDAWGRGSPVQGRGLPVAVTHL